MTRTPTAVSRREFLMPDGRARHYISSAVVVAVPGRVAEVAQAIAQMGGPEIHACENHRIVVVIEASSADELGGVLTAIGNLDGVIAANLVYEHVEQVRDAQS